MASRGHLALLLLGVIIGFAQGKQTEGHDWGYYSPNVAEDERPSRWKDFFPKCGGKKQSPIHIYKKEVDYDEDLGDFTFEGYDEEPAKNFTMSNNGHTLQFGVNSDHYISGGGLGGRFKLAQFHLHWGSGNNNGSEHWIDSKHYAAEIHLVHYNTKYNSLSEAVDKDDGLAVLGSAVAVEGEDNEYMADIVDHLDFVAYADSPDVEVIAFPLIQALPRDHAVFYRYPGSLTTPPCYESVTWTVFENHISMSQAQINKLRTELHHSVAAAAGTDEDYKLLDNHREPQTLNDRTVKTNHPSGTTKTSGAQRTGVFFSAVVLGLLAALL